MAPLQIDLAMAPLAGEAATPVLVHADNRGARPPRSPSFARQPAADDHLLAGDVLDLDPAPRAPARLVDGTELLGQHALEALLLACRAHGRPVADVVARHLPRAVVEAQAGQGLAALLVGLVDERFAVHPQQVE